MGWDLGQEEGETGGALGLRVLGRAMGVGSSDKPPGAGVRHSLCDCHLVIARKLELSAATAHEP